MTASAVFSTFMGAVAGMFLALTFILLADRKQLMERIDEATTARIEAEELAAYAQYAAERAQDDTRQAQEAALAAQEAAIEAQQKFAALMERYRYNVQQCLQAGLAEIVLRRNTR